MSTILIRTVLVYIILMLAIKLMGKRQIGEIRVSEFIIALLIAELVASPVTDGDIPLVFVLVPIIALIAIEIIVSYAGTKYSALDQTPCILIEKGEIRQDNLKKVRFAVNELISEVRLKGYPDISMVDYAILEANGNISVFPKAEHQNPTLAQLNIAGEDSGIAQPVVMNGKLNMQSIAAAGKTSEWVLQKLGAQGYGSLADIFLMSVDNAEKIFICPAQTEEAESMKAVK